MHEPRGITVPARGTGAAFHAVNIPDYNTLSLLPAIDPKQDIKRVECVLELRGFGAGLRPVRFCHSTVNRSLRCFDPSWQKSGIKFQHCGLVQGFPPGLLRSR